MVSDSVLNPDPHMMAAWIRIKEVYKELQRAKSAKRQIIRHKKYKK
jgi:hypothetical protein